MGIGAVRAALIAAAALALFYAMPAAGSPPRTYGRELVVQYQLPADAVARYAAAFATASGEQAASKRSAWADDTTWVGPMLHVGAGRNPYTLVLTISGVARASSDIRAEWQTGWEVRESPLATREVLMSVGSQLSGSTTAGAPVTLTAISAPLTFRGQRQVAPLLNLVHANNLDISDVQLQVWSGSAPWVAWPAWAAPRAALLGLGALCLLAWFCLRRSSQRPVPAPLATVSRLPAADLPSLLEHDDHADRQHESKPASAVLAPAAKDQVSRVVTALRDVMTKGLAVPTELDNKHRQHGGRSAHEA